MAASSSAASGGDRGPGPEIDLARMRLDYEAAGIDTRGLQWETADERAANEALADQDTDRK